MGERIQVAGKVHHVHGTGSGHKRGGGACLADARSPIKFQGSRFLDFVMRFE